MTSTPPFAPGSIVWVQPRAPAFRHQGWHPHGCWPAVVTACTPLPRYGELGDGYDVPDGADTSAVRYWRVTLEPCGVPGRAVDFWTARDTVTQQPCASCQAAWTAAGWAQLQEGRSDSDGIRDLHRR